MHLKTNTSESTLKIKETNRRISTREISLMAVLAALYAVSFFLPFSQFIGGAAFITFSIIILPILCKFLRPIPAMVAGVIGMAIAASVGVGLAPVYGLYSFAIPLVAGLLGSLSFHYRWGAIPGIAFLAVCGYLYAAYSGGTLLWLVPYAAAIIAAIIGLLVYNDKRKSAVWNRTSWIVIIGCFIYLTTMIENATMNLGSIFILQLPGPLWTVITPVSILERVITLAIVLTLLTALWSRFRGKLKELNYE
jgi:hypothetical protein